MEMKGWIWAEGWPHFEIKPAWAYMAAYLQLASCYGTTLHVGPPYRPEAGRAAGPAMGRRCLGAQIDSAGQARSSQAEGRGFESHFPLQDTYTSRKAGHFAQPLSFQANGHLLSRQRVCAPLLAFGGPGLPLAALPDTDGILAPYTLVLSLKSNIGSGLVFGGQVRVPFPAPRGERRGLGREAGLPLFGATRLIWSGFSRCRCDIATPQHRASSMASSTSHVPGSRLG